MRLTASGHSESDPASHHDNLDCFDSTYHPWNTTRVGPQKDIVGTWEKLVRSRGLRFCVSNYAAHAWHWLQTAYGYAPEGPLAGIRYDAYTTTRRDGRGKWWDGLDPLELYAGRNIVMPDGIKTIAEAKKWHAANDRIWNEDPPSKGPKFTRTWYLRCKELLDKHRLDMLYFDDTELPLGQTGLDITAHYYNVNLKWHSGSQEAVVAAKEFTPARSGEAMLDIECGRAQGILQAPWQTDTCIGDWHYSRPLFEEHKYKTPSMVAQILVDIVSKNGNLMLNIPVRGDGTIDEDEYAFLETFGRWMAVHGEAIYGTRPFKVYGEGPQDVNGSPNFKEVGIRPLDANDVRYTQKGNVFYAFIFGWPEDGRAHFKSLRQNIPFHPETVRSVELLGMLGKLFFKQSTEDLVISLPPRPENHLDAFAFRIQS
jgi:alpha-L-fucosidase